MTIIDAASTLTGGTLGAVDTNAAAFAVFLQPSNIVASATAAGLSLSVLTAAREAMGGVAGLAHTGESFVRRATIAANMISNAA